MTITNIVPASAKIAAWRTEHSRARLTEAVLCDLLGTADLRDANLWRANLEGADLEYANLRDAYLRDADLRDANLRGANLRDANLRDANLRDANLEGANLWGAKLWGAISISTPSGSGYLVPTAEGWRITIGCWRNKTLDDLRTLVAGNDWPESTGAERERRRPVMAGLLALCEAHVVYHAALVPALAAKWGEVK